jgi:hypothetical protein
VALDPWALTGYLGAPPLAPPAGIVERIADLGAPLGLDPRPLLAQRAADAGFVRSGDVTCGGAGRLLPAADGLVAVNLAREEDVELVPAWLEVADPGRGEHWAVVAAEVAGRASAEVVDRATLLGLPVAADGEVAVPTAPVGTSQVGDDLPPLDGAPLVVDLSSLWAGPLCTRLLADRGARVVKVESPTRPDGARRGPRAFFDRLHAGKELRSLDLAGEALRALLARADVVVEGSRARALRQHGIVAEELRPRVWVSITGHGRASDRVAFGDDAAVAGGLVAREPGGRPCFVADAVADPLTGVAAAAAVVAALDAGGRWMLDASMAAVSAWVAGADRGAAWTFS